ncbi:hypothetical protein VPH35_039944 [Triticum aestivum]|uniref:uncharacterized protein n=1 Tax=Triticum aestivum TaxID=4565 RepID=UPI001D0208F5|nr:uncharacterized protein LOC123054637 [Triticum aestivum]
MEASAAAHGERVVTATRGGSAAVRCDVVRAKSTVVAETRRSRRTCVVAQRSRRLGATTVEARGTKPRRTCVVAQRLRWRGVAAWRCCAMVEAAAVQGNKSRRRAGRDRCVLWVRTGRVGHVGTAGARTSMRLTLEEAYVAVVLESVLEFAYILLAFVVGGCHGGRVGSAR